jgi:rod shape-determining protein MreD
MITTLIAIPILVILSIFQSALLSRFQLLSGMPDLVLLVLLAWGLQKRVTTALQWGIIGGLITQLFSAVPVGVPVVSYLLSVGLALYLRTRVWQVPILAMFIAVIAGTLISHLTSLVALQIVGNSISWYEAINLVTLPSLLLNLLLAIPVYLGMGELAGWLYPEKLEA